MTCGKIWKKSADKSELVKMFFNPKLQNYKQFNLPPSFGFGGKVLSRARSGFQIPGLFCDFLLVSLGSVLKGSGKYTAFPVISIEQVPVFLHQFSHFRAVSTSK
jgi:hypothetical protein